MPWCNKNIILYYTPIQKYQPYIQRIKVSRSELKVLQRPNKKIEESALRFCSKIHRA